jgi:haloacetate dehalogenase
MAQDQVEVMAALSFDQFFVASHDLGARTAYRMALDHPDKVRKFASIDIIPTHSSRRKADTQRRRATPWAVAK